MGRDPNSKPLRPHDFFPTLPVPKPKRMSGEDIFATMKAFMDSRQKEA